MGMSKRHKVVELMLIVLYCYLLQPYYMKNVEHIQRVFYYSVILFPFIFFSIKHIKRAFVDFNESLLYLAIFAFLVIYLVAIVFHNTWDFGLLIEEILPLLLKTFSKCSFFAIWYYLFKRNKIKMNAIEIMLNAVVLYIIGTIFFIVFPGIKMIWQESLVQSDINVRFSMRKEYLTRFGFAGFSGFETSFYVAACFPLVFWGEEKGIFSKKKAAVYKLFFILGAVFYGRIAIVASAAMILMWAIYYFLNNKPNKLLKVISIIFVGVLGLAFVYIFDVGLKSSLSWVLEPIDNYMKYGKFSSLSTDSLKSMYKFFNPDLKTLIIGVGKWRENGTFYGNTDVWFMRTIYMGGMLFCFLYALCGILVIKCLNNELEKQFGKTFTFIVLAITLLIVYEAKGGCILYMFIFYYPLLWIYSSMTKGRALRMEEMSI